MPGGNTSSKKRPYRMSKASSQASPDVKALSGGEVFGDPGNLQLWGAGSEEYIDTRFGYDSFARSTPNATPKNVDGNAGWESAKPPSAPAGPRVAPKKGDATPGGGW